MDLERLQNAVYNLLVELEQIVEKKGFLSDRTLDEWKRVQRLKDIFLVIELERKK